MMENTYRTLVYLDTDSMMIRKIEIAEYEIAFRFREQGYKNLSDVYRAILEEYGVSIVKWDHSRSSKYIMLSYRPYIWTTIDEVKMLRHYIDVLNDGISTYDDGRCLDLLPTETTFAGYARHQAYHINRSFAVECYQMARSLLSRGLKAKLKTIRRDHSFVIIHNLLTKQIKEYETSQQ